MRILLNVAALLFICAYLAEAKVTGKHKRAVDDKRVKRGVVNMLDIPAEKKCEDLPNFCSRYAPMDCVQTYVKENCKRMCGKCGPKHVQLPLVLYYNKDKHGEKKRVTRGAPPQMNEQILFNHYGTYQKMNFHFTKEHPVHAVYPKNDQATTTGQQNVAATAQSNDQYTGQQPAAVAQPQAVNDQYTAQQPAAPTQPQTFKAQTAPASDPSPVVSSYPAQVNSDNTLNVKLPASAVEQAKQGKDVYVAVLNDDNQKTADQATTQQTADQAATQQMNDKPQETKEQDAKPEGPKCPYGKCPTGLPKAPKVNYPFMVYCDDKFPNCGVLHSPCNDSWMQLYCPKRCNLCKPEDVQQNTEQQQQADVPAQETQPQADATHDYKVYPTEVTEINDAPKLESQLIAPAPGDRPQKAKYVLHVKPKLLNGKPQPQEIAIMPFDAKPGSKVKPLVVLKQTVSKPMVENIEIDVPKKGAQYSAEPKVEVIEGHNKESLSVTKGQADLSSAEAALEAKKQQDDAAAAAAAAATAAVAVPAETAPQNTQAQADTTQQTQAAQTQDAAQPQAAQATAPQAEQPQQAAQQDQTQATQAAPAQAQTTAAEQTQTTQQDTQTQQAAPTQAPQITPTQAYQAPASYQDQTAQAAQQPAQSYQPAAQQADQTQATQQQADQTQATQQQADQTQATQQQADQTQATQQQTYQAQAEQTQATQPQADQTPTAQPQAYQAQAYPTQATAQPAYNPYARNEVVQPAADKCTDESLCATYNNNMCQQPWLVQNCKKKCNLCT